MKTNKSGDVLSNMLSSLSQGNADQIKVFLELGHEIATGLTSLSEEQKKENLESARQFLNCSKEDVEATRLLFEKQRVALSIYHLQQAVEKATKAYALAFFAVTKEELLKIGHKSPLTFIRILNRRWAKRYIEILKMFYPDLKTNVDEVAKTINLKKTQVELARLPKSVILSFLDLNEKIRGTLESDETQKQMYSQIENLLGSLKDFIPGVNTADMMKSLRTNFRFDMVCSFVSLYLLSVVTYPHSEFTRYPDREIKSSDYSADLGIVQSVNEILSQVESGIKVLEDYFAESRDNGD